MKKSNKGFTLIELLAIIVILAIIAVITVPIILNIIETARNGAAKNSVTGYGKAVELAFTEYQFSTQLGEDYAEKYKNKGQEVKVTIDSAEEKTTLYVNYEGDDVDCTGSDGIKITDGKLTLDDCKVGKAGTKQRGPFDYVGGQAVDSNTIPVAGD